MTGNKNIIKLKLKIISNNRLKYFLYINYIWLIKISLIELIANLAFLKIRQLSKTL